MSKRIMITLSDKKAKELDKLAHENGVTKSVLITLLIEKMLKKGESNKSE